jgi:hypothetical protein
MLKSFMIAAGILFLTAVPAASQDLVLRRLLQQICLPEEQEMRANSNSKNTVGTRALSIGMTENSSMWGTDYTLNHPNGIYRVSGNGDNCLIIPPASVDRSRIDQSISQMLDSSWNVSFGNEGATWTRGSGRQAGNPLSRISVYKRVVNNPAVQNPLVIKVEVTYEEGILYR